MISPEIKGFTFNPSIFKKLKISNYLDACKKYASLAGNKPISLEVIADTEKEIIYQIVGEAEADLEKGLLNINSPLARALIGKEEGDEVEVNTPGGTKHYEIIKIEYH